MDSLWAPDRRRLTTGLVLTITLVAFESLAISTVMPVVADDLGGLGLYGWVFSGFFLGTLLGIVVAGQLADERGTALPFALGLGLFSIGLLGGGLAPSMGVLVAARVVQGVGAGAIPAVAYTTVGRAYPAALRPRVFAVFASAWVIPGLIGPAASTGIAHAVSWRGVFLALLPLVLLATALTLPVLTRSVVRSTGDGDDDGDEAAVPFRGERFRQALTLMVGVAAILAATSGAPLVVAVLGVAVGVPVAARAFMRLVPRGTVRLVAGMPATVAVRGILTFAFFSTDAYVSLALQDVRDQPTWVAGVALTSTTLFWSAGSWVQDRLVRTLGPRRLVAIGFALVGVGVVGMLGALGTLPVAVAIPVAAIGGAGMGLAYPCLSVTVLAQADEGKEGLASASIQLTDVLGTSLGTGCGGALLATAEAQDWTVHAALGLTFAASLVVAVLGIAAARRLPVALPGVSPR